MALSNVSYRVQQVGDRNGKFQYYEFITSLTSSGAAESVTLAAIIAATGITGLSQILDTGPFTGVNTAAVAANIATALTSVGATLAAASYRITIKAI
jgi:hypothetical protein